MAAQVLAARYELFDQLGAGAMATVWRARDRRLDREVAIKMLSQPLASDPAFRERFEREAIHVAALKHPNIVTVYDSGAEDGSYYIVMEFIEGQSLQSMLSAASPYLTLAETERLAGELLAGLGHAHRKGIVHRDIKPANILVTDENMAKLADFGIARASRDVQKLTATGSFLGTPLYSSPEQLDGRPTSAASDLYSVGCVLYECLLGHPPFEADMPAGVIAQHLTKAPRPMRAERPEISPQLEAVVLRALEKGPDRRFDTAEEMSQCLIASRVPSQGPPLAADHPTPAPSDDRPTVSPERLRPDPLEPSKAIREPLLAKPDERRSRTLVLSVIGALIGLLLLSGLGAGGYALVSNTSSSKPISSTSTTAPTTVASTSPSVAPSTTTPSDTNGSGTSQVTTNQQIYVRSQADLGAQQLALIPSGTTLTAACADRDGQPVGPSSDRLWVQVTYHGQAGFIPERNTGGGQVFGAAGPSPRDCPVAPVQQQQQTPPNPLSTPGPSGQLYVVTQGVVIRDSASSSGNTLGSIPAAAMVGVQCKTTGETITGPYGPDSNWDRVAYNGVTGLITDQYIDTKGDEADPTKIPNC